MRAYLALIRIDLKLALRARSVIFFNYLFPLIFFFVFAQSFHASQGSAITQVVTMVTVIGTLGNGLFGAGIRAVQERENNVLRRYKVTPIGPLPLLVASTITGLLTYLPYVVLMMLLAHFIYGMAVPNNLPSILIFIAFGIVAFRALGLIIAAVVNSMQESAILTQVLYIAMLFLSGASFPTSMFPGWLLTLTEYLPATYLVNGLQGLFLRRDSLLDLGRAMLAFTLTAAVGLFIATKLFRWEKEEKLRPAAKLWVLGVLVPFVALGTFEVYSKEDIARSRINERELRRSRTLLIQDARIIVGDGKVIESGSILVKDGKIAEVFEGGTHDAQQLQAEPIEAAGKTVMPGLIDAHVHLGSAGGFYAQADAKEAGSVKVLQRELESYLFSGVTAVKSAADMTDSVLALRDRTRSGEILTTQLYVVGPLFTAPHGHGTEYFKSLPDNVRRTLDQQFERIPKSPEEARGMVDELKKRGVDGIKAILEGGAAGAVFERLDLNILRAIADEARKQDLPMVVHVGDTQDIRDALAAGVTGIEHGSYRDVTPPEVFQEMARKGVTYDPTLSVVEGFLALRARDARLLNRPLLEQAAPPNLIRDTKAMLARPAQDERSRQMAQYPMDLGIAQQNLQAAWRAGVTLVTGSDAGNPLVIHGPTTQHEMELWVAAGLPAEAAIRGATVNAAKLLRQDRRFGAIRKGMDATLLILNGNPLEDIRQSQSISSVLLKGERVDRSSDLFDQE